MKKEQIINASLEAIGGKKYLEIGVYQGGSIHAIKAKKRWGVDPSIVLSQNPIKNFLKKKIDFLLGVRYFEMTSDEFFKLKKSQLQRMQMDVYFIDGLHTYEQALLDVQNCLELQGDDCIIVMHDCNPVTSAMAIPATCYEDAARMNLENWTGEWTGDVWKVIVKLRSTRQDLFICVLDCDYGVALIRKGMPESVLNYTDDQICAMTYTDLESRREYLLNLKDPNFIHTFLQKQS